MDDLDFVMEMLKDELNITTETAQAQAMARRAAQVQGYRNAANRSGFVSPQAARQVQATVANQAPGSASAQNIPQRQPAPTPAPVQTQTAPAKPATTSTTAAKPASTPPTKPTAQPTTKPNPAPPANNVAKPTATNTGVMQGPTRKPFEKMSTSELQKDSSNRMGRIYDMINQMKTNREARANSPVGKSVQSAQAHYNTLTNQGTQSVPAGVKPTTIYKNTGDVNAAKTAANAQRNEMFNTKPTGPSTPPSNSTTTTSTNTAPTRGGSVAKTR